MLGTVYMKLGTIPMGEALMSEAAHIGSIKGTGDGLRTDTWAVGCNSRPKG